jgi:hypothetical protein
MRCAIQLISRTAIVPDRAIDAINIPPRRRLAGASTLRLTV